MSEGLRVLRFPTPARPDTRPVLAASIAVFRTNGTVLIATRTKPPATDVWSLPGGKVEPGETLEAAALRELKEEVGLEARMLGFNRHLEIIHREGADGAEGRVLHHFVVASFVGEWTAGEATTGPEAGAVKWVNPFNLAGLPTTRGLGEVLRAAHAIWTAAR